MLKKLSKEDLLAAKVYEPSALDTDWIELKAAVQEEMGVTFNDQTVGDIAKYLLKNKEFGLNNDVVARARKLYLCFKLAMLNDPEPIEACPDKSGVAISLPGGNKRSIAYAMKLLAGEIAYTPVNVLWHEEYTRDDTNNRMGLETTKSEIVC